MKCPYNECEGTGFIPIVAENGEQEFKPCKCRLDRSNRDSIKKRRIDARIPVKYWDYTLQNYKDLSKFLPPTTVSFNTPSISLIENYLTDIPAFMKSPQVLWIWGPDDNACHTTLSVILGEELLKQNRKVLYVEFYKLLEMFVDFENKSGFFKELNNHEIYIIDDAFDTTRCTPSNYKQGQLFGFLNDILNANKHLICTSNTSLSTIDPLFYQLRVILSRSVKELEIRGSVLQALRKNTGGKITNI
jgi:hypothetical protein